MAMRRWASISSPISASLPRPLKRFLQFMAVEILHPYPGGCLPLSHRSMTLAALIRMGTAPGCKQTSPERSARSCAERRIGLDERRPVFVGCGIGGLQAFRNSLELGPRRGNRYAGGQSPQSFHVPAGPMLTFLFAVVGVRIPLPLH